jgi:hypothetical protein
MPQSLPNGLGRVEGSGVSEATQIGRRGDEFWTPGELEVGHRFRALPYPAAAMEKGGMEVG